MIFAYPHSLYLYLFHNVHSNIFCLITANLLLHFHNYCKSLNSETTYLFLQDVFLIIQVCNSKMLQTFPSHCLILIFQNSSIVTLLSYPNLQYIYNHNSQQVFLKVYAENLFSDLQLFHTVLLLSDAVYSCSMNFSDILKVFGSTAYT